MRSRERQKENRCKESLNKALGMKMEVDGVMGPTIRKALKEAERQGLLRDVHNEVINKRIQDYKRQARDLPKQSGYLNGWLDRVRKFVWPPLPRRKPVR